MPSNNLILCCPLLLLHQIFLSISVFCNESPPHIRWPNYWSFSLASASVLLMHIQDQFPLGFTDLISLHSKGLSSLLQHHSSKASVLQCSAFFMVQLSHPYMTTGKTIALTGQTFLGKVMSLLFNMLTRVIIAFLPRSKCLLISWLQSPSAVMLEPPLHNQKKKKNNKVSHCFPIYLPWSNVTGCHDLSFLNVEL